ncbi:MAG: NUDIX hydrolase [Pseudomonadota bacterium]
MSKPTAPKVTVSAVAERNGSYLTIEESIRGRRVLNQPAGHLENHESLTEAVARECFEESGWQFEPEYVLGIYCWEHPTKHFTILRIAFGGRAHSYEPGAILDEGIVRALWMTPEEILAQTSRLRTPLVAQALVDHAAGHRYPLDLFSSVDLSVFDALRHHATA